MLGGAIGGSGWPPKPIFHPFDSKRYVSNVALVLYKILVIVLAVMVQIPVVMLAYQYRSKMEA